MSGNMLGEALREITGLQLDLWQKLHGEEGARWHMALKTFLRKENPWPSLLELVATVELPAIAAFLAEDHFIVGEVEGVKIGSLAPDFRREFLGGAGRLETAVEAVTLGVHRLCKHSVNEPIIAELGGQEQAKTTLGQMWKMLRRQGQGQKGVLPTDGRVTVFYIPNAKGVLWTVACYRHHYFAEWRVEAPPITDLTGWSEGHHVVSCSLPL